MKLGLRKLKVDEKLKVDFAEARIDSIFSDLDQCHLPGAAVGIAVDGSPVYRKGFGLADMGLPVVLSPTIRMRIGSTTKQFTSLAYLLLCEHGKAHVDDPIVTHVPELPTPFRDVTMRHLMGNVSGLRDPHEICWQFSGAGQQVLSDDLLELYQQFDDTSAAPGTAWIYSNGGYLLLSIAIERISGRPLEDVLRESIFEPIGMNDTRLRRVNTDFLTHSAALHMTNRQGGFERSCNGTALAGEGGMVSTVDDMLRWLAHMETPFVGSAQTWDTMKTPLRLHNGVSTGYGMGLVSSSYRGVETLSHPGGVLGGNAQLLKVPAASLDIVVIVNRHDVTGMTLVDRVLDACLPHLPLSEETVTNTCTTGVFRSSTTRRVVQLLVNEGQQIASIDGIDMTVEVGRDGVLWPVGIWSFIKQGIRIIGSAERPSAIELNDFGNLERLEPVPEASALKLDEISGRYRSDSTATEAMIAMSDDGPRITTVGRFGKVSLRLSCLGEGVWRATPADVMFPLGYILSFGPDATEYRVFSSRVRSLPFHRVG